MNLTTGLKKISAKIVSRVRYDDLLYTTLQVGAAALAVSSPAIAPVAIYINAIHCKNKKYSRLKLKNSFYYFQKAGLISVEYFHGNTSVVLTGEGEQRARLCGTGKILSENIVSRSKKWDGMWRLVFFDLKNEKNKERNAIRIMLRRCGFIFLQKSVWIYPYDCSVEVEFLRSFFRLSEEEFRLVVSGDIGDDNHFRKHFCLVS